MDDQSMEAARRTLRSVFGHADFRAGQAVIVEAVLAGRDVLGVLPTGTGKSVCFQLPALLLEGLTVVVTPLIALMRDQVEHLQARGVDALLIHGGLPEAEQARRLEAVGAGAGRLLYLAPERLRQPDTLAALAGRRIGLLVVDEAHCVSQWGHNFRPAYLDIAPATERLSIRSTVALTATATEETRRDLIGVLRLRDPLVHVGRFFRPNLLIGVKILRAGSSWLRGADRVGRRLDAARIEAARGLLRETEGPAIVYAATRAQAESAAAALGAVYYHAGLTAMARDRAQDRFVRGESRVVVATNAFGLGVDKSDVRAVVHLQMPGSLEAYYQEIGRGGRDGGACHCTLLYADGDEILQERLLEASHPPSPLARRLVAAAQAGRLLATRPGDVPRVGPRDLMTTRQTLDALTRLGLIRVGDHGQVRVRDENLSLLENLDRSRLHGRQRIRRMAAFARQQRGCRHDTVLRWFGQRVGDERRMSSCGSCDLCRRLD